MAPFRRLRAFSAFFSHWRLKAATALVIDHDDPDDNDDQNESYLVLNIICGKNLYCHKKYLVIKAKEVKIVKEVKRSDGL